MKHKIVLFTANIQGGILQFSLQLYKVLKEMKYDVMIFMPLEIKETDISPIANRDLYQYRKLRKVVNHSYYKEIAMRINAISPDYLWYMDDSVICSNIGLYIDERIKQLLTLHDAGTHHLSNQKGIRDILLSIYTESINRKFYKKVHRFVLLSKESIQTFADLYSKYASQEVLMNLGAHMPDVKEMIPPEILGRSTFEYLLFFGRIDKYKGLRNLLSAYQNISTDTIHLVIAGFGNFSQEEEKLIQSCRNITIINRYILDGEMKWLIKNSNALLLPYIEATQSGVIPLAYMLKKPVFVSNVQGLTQFVVDNHTGFICRDQEEWQTRITQFNNQVKVNMEHDIEEYYKTYFNWNDNIKELFDSL